MRTNPFRRPSDLRGFTLMELLITTVMIGMVFLGAGSVYLSSLKFMQTQQSVDVSTTTVVSLEKTLGRELSLANQAIVGGGGAGPSQQMDIRADYAVCNFNTLNGGGAGTPGDFTDDNYWHYRFVNGALRMVCDNAAGTNVNGASPILIPNVNAAASSFEMVNPSGQGDPTVVAIRVVTTSPAATLDTRVALGAVAKR